MKTSRNTHTERSARASLIKGLLTLSACALLAPQPAYAYVDPSIVTYAIQSIAAVSVALSAVAGVAFRKSRKAIFRLLNIDANANALTEPKTRQADPAERMDIDKEASDYVRSVEDRRRNGAQLSWRQRLWRAAIASTFLVYTVLVVAPIELLVSNASDLVCDVRLTLPPIILAGILIAVALTMMLSTLRGKAFTVALLIVVGLGIAAYLQSMFLNTGLPSANGTAVDWSEYDKITLVSTLVWLAVLGICLVAALKTPQKARAGCMVLATFLVIVQSVGIASLFIGGEDQSSKSTKTDSIVISHSGLYSVASHNNIIVFVLDTMDTSYVLDILDEDPTLLNEFTGFTFYPDSVSSMIPTRYGVTTLLTGYTIDNDQDPRDYLSNLYNRSDFLNELRDLKYSLYIFSKNCAFNQPTREYLEQRVENIHYSSDSASISINAPSTVLMMYQCAFYRDMPWILKPPFWYYTEDINAAIIGDDGASDYATPWVNDDAKYYASLAKRGLEIDQSEDTGAFRFIHLVGAHKPYTMDENAKRVGKGNSSLEQQAKGSFLIVNTYLQELKKLGVYDDATIIVTADHGIWEYNVDELSQPSSSVMLVKPAQSADEAAAPLKRSDALVSQWDVNPTIIQAAGGDTSQFEWTGESIFQTSTEPRKRYFLQTVHNSKVKEDYTWREYLVDGYALDFDNWSYTGKTWELPFTKIEQVS